MPNNKDAIPIGDPKEIFTEAEAFCVASYAIHDMATRQAIKNNINTAVKTTFAAFVNHAYACELYLKCLCGIEKGYYFTGHNLIFLFRKVSEENQQKLLLIMMRVCYTAPFSICCMDKIKKQLF